jgi:nitroimidazol reductase NimA-like FMN-containing flavoprotein (pyridoxamine 5'-phosphate oxidase superfamily)
MTSSGSDSLTWVTTGTIDPRFSSPTATAPPWSEVEQLLVEAELYWLTTVRADGRPHVAPLVGVWHDGGFAFCTGLDEQKMRNLEANPEVVVATGTNTWQRGTDVVVEGRAVRVTGSEALAPLAAAWYAKYGEDWHWSTDDEGFVYDDNRPWVFRVETRKVMAFAKHPHGQSTYRV